MFFLKSKRQSVIFMTMSICTAIAVVLFLTLFMKSNQEIELSAWYEVVKMPHSREAKHVNIEPIKDWYAQNDYRQLRASEIPVIDWPVPDAVKFYELEQVSYFMKTDESGNRCLCRLCVTGNPTQADIYIINNVLVISRMTNESMNNYESFRLACAKEHLNFRQISRLLDGNDGEFVVYSGYCYKNNTHPLRK